MTKPPRRQARRKAKRLCLDILSYLVFIYVIFFFLAFLSDQTITFGQENPRSHRADEWEKAFANCIAGSIPQDFFCRM